MFLLLLCVAFVKHGFDLCIYTSKKFFYGQAKILVNLYMLKHFKELYPSTRVIVDATEIFVETPALPEF